MKSRILASLLAIAMIAAFGVVWAQERTAPSGEDSSNLFHCMTAGAGQNFFKWCVSNHGNLTHFESPIGQNHVIAAQEGYAVCSSAGVHGWDAGSTETGFVDVSVTQPGGLNTLPLTIIRRTADGKFLLTLTFAQSTGLKSVSMTMKLQNVSGVAQTNVQLARYNDFNMDSSWPGDYADKSADTVWSRKINGLVMNAATVATAHTTAVQYFNNVFNNCAVAPLPTPAGPADLTGRVIYNFGTINNNAAKTVKVTYQKF